MHHSCHLDMCYLLEGGDADPSPGPGESPEVAWFSLDEALAIAGSRIARILQACAAPAS